MLCMQIRRELDRQVDRSRWNEWHAKSHIFLSHLSQTWRDFRATAPNCKDSRSSLSKMSKSNIGNRNRQAPNDRIFAPHGTQVENIHKGQCDVPTFDGLICLLICFEVARCHTCGSTQLLTLVPGGHGKQKDRFV